MRVRKALDSDELYQFHDLENDETAQNFFKSSKEVHSIMQTQK